MYHDEEIRLIAYRIWEEEGPRRGVTWNTGSGPRLSGRRDKDRLNTWPKMCSVVLIWQLQGQVDEDEKEVNMLEYTPGFMSRGINKWQFSSSS